MMDGCSLDHGSSKTEEKAKTETLSTGVEPGSTVVLAAPAPLLSDAGLRVLCERATGDDTALVVTTTEGAEETVATFDRRCPADRRPSIGVVDTTAGQSVTALYGETPVVYTPSPADLERFVLALSELAGNASPSTRERHLLVRSLTPILDAAPATCVVSVLERITGLRSADGCCLLGIDPTVHDRGTVAAVTGLADGVLRLTRTAEGGLDASYRSVNGR